MKPIEVTTQQMRADRDHELFPLCDGEPMTLAEPGQGELAIKNAVAHASFHINQLLMSLYHLRNRNDDRSERESVLIEFEKARNRRNDLLAQCEDRGIEMETEIMGLTITNLDFKTFDKKDCEIPPGASGHQFDITIPILSDDLEMEKNLRTQLAPLFAKGSKAVENIEGTNSDI